MTNVCVVVENHPSAVMGGAQYQGHLLAEELARQPGARVTYLARRANLARWQADGAPYAVRVIGNGDGIRRRAVAFDAGTLRAALEDLRPDVVYQQMRQSYTAVCASYALSRKVPFFFHIASDMDLNPSWLPDRLINGNLPFDILEAATGIWGMKRASHIIAQTDRQARVLKERFGRDAAVIVRNFQPLPETLPAKPDDGITRVFWVANFKDVKRPELFVELADSMRANPRIQFLMAGRPSSLPRHDALMKKIATMQNLKYLGELTIDQVNTEMARADLHVNTSSIEGFPNTFIQAWAQGAIVATIAVDPEEEGMENLGVGFCTGTLEGLKALIERLAADPAARRRIMDTSFAFAHAKHALARGTELAQGMIRAALEARRPAP